VVDLAGNSPSLSNLALTFSGLAVEVVALRAGPSFTHVDYGAAGDLSPVQGIVSPHSDFHLL